MSDNLDDLGTPSGKSYNFKTINQIIKVINHDNMIRFLCDFQVYLNLVIDVHERFGDQVKIIPEFMWTDDGEHFVKKIKTTNRETGQVIIFEGNSNVKVTPEE